MTSKTRTFLLILFNTMINIAISSDKSFAASIIANDSIVNVDVNFNGPFVDDDEDDSSINILMIGNSYTYFNNLDQIIAILMREGLGSKKKVYAENYVCSGASLSDQSIDDNLRNKITNDKPWDYVILQELSTIPGLYETNSTDYEKSMRAIKTLNDFVLQTPQQQPPSETVLFMTWGERFGNQKKYPDLYSNFTSNNHRITEGYYRYQDVISSSNRPVKIAPVGLAYKNIYDAVAAGDNGMIFSDPSVQGTDFSNLYYRDDKHSTLVSTYLIACVFYATLTGNDPRGLKCTPPGINDGLRDYLQLVASDTINSFNKAQNLPPLQRKSYDLSLPSAAVCNFALPRTNYTCNTSFGYFAVGLACWPLVFLGLIIMVGIRSIAQQRKSFYQKNRAASQKLIHGQKKSWV